MSKFIAGIVVGIVISTVGFNGLANLGNNAVKTIQSAAQFSSHQDKETEHKNTCAEMPWMGITCDN